MLVLSEGRSGAADVAALEAEAVPSLWASQVKEVREHSHTHPHLFSHLYLLSVYSPLPTPSFNQSKPSATCDLAVRTKLSPINI